MKTESEEGFKFHEAFLEALIAYHLQKSLRVIKIQKSISDKQKIISTIELAWKNDN